MAKKIYRLQGFTLAEVLITLGIIGIVAAMTIPSLINNSQDVQFRSAWKKTYSNLSQAHQKLVSDNGGTIKDLTANDANSNINALDYFLPYLSYRKRCVLAQVDGCWHANNQFYFLNSTPYSIGGNSTAGAILNDGTLIFYRYSPTCATVCGYMFVDTNGFKSPNKIGKDIHFIYLLPDRLIPRGVEDDPSGAGNIYTKCNLDTGVNDSDNYGYGCSVKYLSN